MEGGPRLPNTSITGHARARAQPTRAFSILSCAALILSSRAISSGAWQQKPARGRKRQTHCVGLRGVPQPHPESGRRGLDVVARATHEESGQQSADAQEMEKN